MANFTEIPTLALSQAQNPETKPAFLEELRSTLINVGFLYLSETGLDEELVERVCAEARRFFEELPTEEKLKIEMKNEKSFLGYSRVSVSFVDPLSFSHVKHRWTRDMEEKRKEKKHSNATQ